MVALFAAFALVATPTWAAPVSFRPLPGWRTAASGTVHVIELSDGRRIRELRPRSTAWIANVRYRDPVTADPPNRTLEALARRGRGVVVWVLIEPTGRFDRRLRPTLFRLERARRFLCCDGLVPSSYVSQWELDGYGPANCYRVIVRIYLPLRPQADDIRAARRALGALRLPGIRR
jgi:hypothetical protein